MAIECLLPKRPPWFWPIKDRGGALGAVDSWAQLGGRASLGAGADFREGGALREVEILVRCRISLPTPSYSWLLQEPDDLVTMLRIVSLACSSRLCQSLFSEVSEVQKVPWHSPPPRRFHVRSTHHITCISFLLKRGKNQSGFFWCAPALSPSVSLKGLVANGVHKLLP